MKEGEELLGEASLVTPARLLQQMKEKNLLLVGGDCNKTNTI